MSSASPREFEADFRGGSGRQMVGAVRSAGPSPQTGVGAGRIASALVEAEPWAEPGGSLDEQVVAGARRLARQIRALQVKYEEEHRRLADTLEFLTVQSQDLERELQAFGELADRLEAGRHQPRLAVVAGGLTAGEAEPPPRRGPKAVLEVRTLGGFEVRYGGRSLDLGASRKGRQAFKFLVVAARNGSAPKERLAELLWPETPLERSLTSLQSALYQVRRAVARSEPGLAGYSLVVFKEDHYSLDPALELRSDLDLFRRRLKTARALDGTGDADGARQAYRLALEAGSGELLPEESYEEWVLQERDLLREAQLAAATRLVELSERAGEYAEAIKIAEQALLLDPTREELHRAIMRCYARLGQRSRALLQYRRCRSTLELELDVPTEAVTDDLSRQISRGEVV